MRLVFDILKEKGFTCYHSDRLQLDDVSFEPYQDRGEEFLRERIFETNNKSGKFISIQSHLSDSFFRYFLDGSRMTYKIGDIVTSDGKFMPIIAGQLAAGVCERTLKKIHRKSLKRMNTLLLFKSINESDIEDIKRSINHKQLKRLNNIEFFVDTYQKKDDENRPENFAIAKIQKVMMDMEIALLEDIVNDNLLKPHQMLVIDGSLQFSRSDIDPRLFANVVGISKTFNPNLQGLLKNKNHQIGTAITRLEFGQRTPVYEYEYTERRNSRKIGAWYLRIRQRDYTKNPIEGIVKIEKIATSEKEMEDGFESCLINNISQSVLLERNVTCYGKDKRWANHIYPIYLTEKMLKESFVSPLSFLNSL